jgi:hypothetical protein
MKERLPGEFSHDLTKNYNPKCLFPASHLDDGVRIDMKPGDVCVQRGTIHGWTNYTDKPARVYFILTGMSSVYQLFIKEMRSDGSFF